MSVLRDSMTAAAFIGLLAVSLFAALQVASSGVASNTSRTSGASSSPQSPPSGLAAMREALVGQDLETAGDQQKQALLSELEDQLSQETDWRAELGEMDDAEKKQLEKNLITLTRTWLRDQVDRYDQLDGEQRTAFLDRHIEQGIGVFRRFRANPDASSPLGANKRRLAKPAIGAPLSRLQQAFAQASPEEKTQALRFFSAIHQRWKERQRQDGDPIVRENLRLSP